MITVASIITGVREDLADNTATRWTTSNILRYINECITELNLVAHLNRKEYYGFISNGDKYLTKPDDLELIDTIYINNTRLTTINQYEASELSKTWILDKGNLTYVVDDYMPEYGLRLFPIPTNIIEHTIIEGVNLDISESVSMFGICLDRLEEPNPYYGLISVSGDISFTNDSECTTNTYNRSLVDCGTLVSSYGGIITDIVGLENDCFLYGAITDVTSEYANTSADVFGGITGVINNNYYLLYVATMPSVVEQDTIAIDKKYYQGIVYYVSSKLLENDSAYADLRLSEIKYKKYLAEIAKYKQLKRDKYTTGKVAEISLYRGFQ